MRADEPHPEVRTLLELVDSTGILPISQWSPERARRTFARFATPGLGPDVETADRTIPGPAADPSLPGPATDRSAAESGADGSDEGAGEAGAIDVRVYRPEGDGPHPVVVFYHGGGFVLGSLDTHDVTCRHLCAAADAVVVSVGYRLAPEHPFPAAVEDAYAALSWVAGDPGAVDGDGSLAVAGDSAGGNLAAVVALMARDREGPDLDRQVLVYPAVAEEDDWPSREENAEGYYLLAEDLEWFRDCYYPSELHRHNPYASPLAACDHSGVAPATVVTAGFDPLRDEGVAYAEALAGAGVPVEHRHYEDAIHGFASFLVDPASLTLAHVAIEAVGEDLRESFG